MKKIGFLLCLAFFANAQDVIILKNGDVIKAKVVEAAPAEVNYIRFDDSTKHKYVIKNSDIRGVKYNATQYYTNEYIQVSDKIFLTNGDTLKASIQDVWGDMIRYKSSSVSNGVIYAMIKSEILGYQQGGSKTEIAKPVEKAVTASPYVPSVQPTQSTNSQPVSTNSASTYSKNSGNTDKKSSWFVVAKLGGFFPVGDFGSDDTSPIIGSTPQPQNQSPFYDGTVGYAKSGFAGGIEAAYFANKYLGFGIEFAYTSLANKIFSTASIPPQYNVETKPWKLFMALPGVYARLPLDGYSLDFKLCMAAVGGVTEGYAIDDSFSYFNVNPEKFTAMGMLFGTDLKVEFSENFIGCIGFDYLGTFEQKIVRLAEQYNADEDELFEDIPLYREISIQAVRLNFGVGIKF